MQTRPPINEPVRRAIDSLSKFKWDTADFLRKLEKRGHPVALTVNGKAELVVHDTASFQRLKELAKQASETEITRRDIAEM